MDIVSLIESTLQENDQLFDAVSTAYNTIFESADTMMEFYHGGNLDNIDSTFSNKTGRMEYGPGLYGITHFSTAREYAKGSRKFYKLYIERGNDINSIDIPTSDAIKFVTMYATQSIRKELVSSIQKRSEQTGKGSIPAYMFLTMLVNRDAIKPSRTTILREFLVEHGVDYELIQNAFGWGDATMIVLFNMNKLKKVERITDTNNMKEFDLPVVK